MNCCVSRRRTHHGESKHTSKKSITVYINEAFSRWLRRSWTFTCHVVCRWMRLQGQIPIICVCVCVCELEARPKGKNLIWLAHCKTTEKPLWFLLKWWYYNWDTGWKYSGYKIIYLKPILVSYCYRRLSSNIPQQKKKLESCGTWLDIKRASQRARTSPICEKVWNNFRNMKLIICCA